MTTNALIAVKKNNAIVFKTRIAADVFVAGGTIVGDVFAGTQPAHAGPLLEATCCKTALGNDSILVEPGDGIIGSHRHFVNQTPQRICDSFAAFSATADNGLIQRTITIISPQ